MDRTEKSFDAVRMMRDIRNRLSRRIRGMSYTEQRIFMDDRLGRESRREHSLRKRNH